MAKKKDIDDLDIGSSYDNFYFDVCIYDAICDITNITNVAQSELNLSLQQNVRGISYFYELLMIDMIDHLENLAINYNVHDVLHWSHSDIGEEAVRDVIKTEPVLKYIFDFNNLRKEFAKIRLKDGSITEVDYKSFLNLSTRMKTMIEDANKFIVSDLQITSLNIDYEKALIINWFLVKYNYVEGDANFRMWLKKEDKPPLSDADIICSYPGGAPFFYTMPKETRRTYHLQHPKILNNNSEYLNGYKIMLVAFYKKYLPDQLYSTAKDLITQAKTWHDIHRVFGKLSDMVETPKHLLKPVFEINKKNVIKDIVSGTTAKSEKDLDLIFRRINNLQIKVLRSNEQYNTETLFYHILLGARYVQNEHIEVLEFKQLYGDTAKFSYAIFIPITSWISDGSYWLFFDELAIASTVNSYKSQGKIFIDGYTQLLKKTDGDKYHFKTYEIDGDLLQKYIYHKDVRELVTAEMNEKIKTSKGLLGQFIAYLYLAKRYDAKLIDISKNIGSTDIDVIAENSEKLFLVQAKTTFPFSKKSLDDLYKHFETIEKSIKTIKQIQKILFVSNEEGFNEDYAQHMVDNELDEMDGTDISTQKESARENLKSKNIEVLTYKDLREMLSVKEYEDFLAKIDKIIDYSELDFEDYWA